MLLGSNYQAWRKKKIYLNQVPQASASCCIFMLNDQVMSSRWPKGQFDRECPVIMIYVIRDLLFTHVTEIKYTYLLTYYCTNLSITSENAYSRQNALFEYCTKNTNKMWYWFFVSFKSEKGSRARLYYLLKKLEPHFSSLEDARREEYLHYSCGWLTQYSTRIWSAPLYLIFVNFGTPPHYLGL